MFIEDHDFPAPLSIVPSPPMDVNEDQVSLQDENKDWISLWDKNEDLYPTIESDFVFSPSVAATALHTEWEPSSDDRCGSELGSLLWCQRSELEVLRVLAVV